MGISDHKYVNFSEDYELNDHLKKAKKAQTEANREVLKEMGKELKEKLDETRLTHEQFDEYIADNLSRLED
ncbi:MULTISPECIES: hypothetical protein [Aeromonas]|uniref:Uncharacterized protein n=1 Tax=Aeromonas dhakensis TaxID=196024 RepID=A0A1L0AYK1_9GAMM|nr:hypothetical protein [Aeromonas dhakensis]SGZ37787.1 Uncharacterised protein [Aeromonas dhakensis]